VHVKASYLLKQNINSLLKARGQSQRDLANWCRRTESWLSQIFTNEDRGIPIKYLDRIADFFGIATYQLFQPGISPLTERRKGGDRRKGERRVSHLTNQLRASLSPVSANLTEADIADLIRLRMLSADSRAVVRKEIDTLDRSERAAAARGPARRGAGTEATAADSPAPRGRRRSGADQG
jgi:transcriptional regulator with XRE-family HTH domain